MVTRAFQLFTRTVEIAYFLCLGWVFCCCCLYNFFLIQLRILFCLFVCLWEGVILTGNHYISPPPPVTYNVYCISYRFQMLAFLSQTHCVTMSE